MTEQEEIYADIIKVKLNTKNKRALENGAKKIYIAKGQFIVERNRRIAIKRAVIILGILIAVWGLVWMMSK
jgi:hypothetical protein